MDVRVRYILGWGGSQTFNFGFPYPILEIFFIMIS